MKPKPGKKRPMKGRGQNRSGFLKIGAVVNHADFLAHLKSKKACVDAVAFVENNEYNLAAAWKNCDNGDWMAWLLWNMPKYPDKKFSVKMAVTFARRVEHLGPEPETKTANDAAQAWLDDLTEENAKKSLEAGRVASAAGEAAGRAASAAGEAGWAAGKF